MCVCVCQRRVMCSDVWLYHQSRGGESCEVLYCATGGIVLSSYVAYLGPIVGECVGDVVTSLKV